MLARLGRWCFRNRRTTLIAWILGLAVVAGVGNGLVGAAFSTEFNIPTSESSRGFDLLRERFPDSGLGGRSGSIVFRADAGAADPTVRMAMEEVFASTDALDGVAVVSPFGGLASNQISDDGAVAYAIVELDNRLDQSRMAEVGRTIRSLADRAEASVPGLAVEVGGQELAGFEPPKSELIGLGFAIIVLILAFGSVLAMGLPIGVALFGVGAGVSIVGLVSHLMTIPDFATTIGAMIGLAVGIDYALFIVTRYRENLRLGQAHEDAASAAMDTAGRAVIFAGMTVVVSLLGMLLIGLQFMSGLGVAASTTVAVTMVASVTLLPALLGFAGPRVEVTRWRGIVAAGLVSVALFGAGLSVEPLLVALPLAVVVLAVGFAVAPLRRELPRRAHKAHHDTLAYRWSRMVQARPWRSVLAGTVLLGAMAAPVAALRLGFSDEGNFSPDTTTRRAYDMLADGFGPGFNAPLVAVVDLGDDADPALGEELASSVARDPGVERVSPVFLDDPSAPTAVLLRIIPTTAPQDEATAETVERLRADVVAAAVAGTGATAHLTGGTAALIDFTDYLAGRLIVFIGVVLAVSFLLLAMVFRSLLVPAKAVLMNVLSIAAAYGVVVAVFQWGWLGALFGTEPAPVEPFVPIMMFAIVFGLSMDYEVFLLSRVREEFDRTGDAKGSVADGLAATAQVITAAAAIMIVVFGSFLLEDDRVIKMFGVGLAVAVFLDATLVRLLLVPATMELLGTRNWWLPRWMDRILPRINVEGPASYEVGHRPTGDMPGGVGDVAASLLTGDVDEHAETRPGIRLRG